MILRLDRIGIIHKLTYKILKSISSMKTLRFNEKSFKLEKLIYINVYFMNYDVNHSAKPASAVTPHVFPDANVMNPLFPHDVPQEFLTIHVLSALNPTKRTAWLSYLAQFEKTPVEYLDQLVASTATVNG